MAVKLFRGDMPELTENILNNLNNECYSLYACARVNRHLCKMSIPILWQDPFSFDKIPKFISRYFSSLEEDKKLILVKCGINIEFPRTLFHYAKFIKVLDFPRLVEKVGQWSNLHNFKSQRRTKNDDIANLLTEIFIKSGATLTKLNVLVSKFIGRPKIFTLGRNDHFFSRLQDISVEIDSEGPYFIEGMKLLEILATNTSKIHTLQFRIGAIDEDYKPKVHYLFVNMIKSQRQLIRFNLIYDIDLDVKLNGIIPALECQRNSLQEIKIFNCDYNLTLEKLIKSKNIEVFRMSYCEEYRLLKSLINGHSKISTLEINSFDLYEDVVSQLAQFLKKSGTLLQRLKLDSEEGIESQTLLLEALMNCTNLIYLYISPIILSTQIPKFIEKLRKLQFFTMKWYYDESENEKSLVVQLAKMLPATLQYLEWESFQSDSYINVLLSHCDAPLTKLIISESYNSEKTKEELIKFCSRKQTLKYLNISCIDLNLKTTLERYVELVPYERIVVNC